MPKATRKNWDAVRFGAIIRRLRKQRGWTLRRLAQRCGMNATYLGVMEAGGNIPSLGTLLDLADVFQVEAAEIVREVEQAHREARRKRAAAVAAEEAAKAAAKAKESDQS